MKSACATLLTIFSALVLLLPPAALSQEEGSDEPVVVHAQSLQRDMKSGLVTGEGAVDLTYSGLRLRADRVVVNEETKLVIADGHVILDDEGGRLQGEHMELDLETRKGFVTEGYGFTDIYFFSGKRIEKLGPASYETLHGSFTTCEGVLPDWKFKSPRAYLEVDRYVTARHPTMWVRKMPVFYLPFAAFPIKRDRATGFLIPELRVNEIDGWIVKNALYWAPRDNFDATVSLEYRENIGWGPGLEFRYITAPGTHGTFDSYYIDEKDGGTSWKVAFNHLHALPYGVRGQADVYVQSDRGFVRRFGDQLEDQAMEKTSSSFYLSKSWTYYDVSVAGLYEESLLTENESSITRFPELIIDRTQSRIRGTGLFWRLTLEGARLRSDNVEEIFVVPGSSNEVLLAEEDVLETTRIDVLPEISYPKALGSWGSITPSLSYRTTHYTRDLEGDSETRLVPTWDLSLEGPRVYRIFEPGSVGKVEKIKHLIEPRISYVYVPEKDQSSLPQFDIIDFISPQNNLVYSLTNTVLGKVPRAEEGRFRTDELLRVKLSQTYDFDAPEVGGETRPFSPMDWDVRSSPNPAWDLRWKGEYDLYDSEVDFQDLSVTWNSAAGTMLRGEWRTTASGRNDFLDLWAQFPLGRKWDWDLRSRYNIDAEEFIENNASFKYTSQCWDVTVGYVKWPEEYEFRFQLGLKGIGNVVNFWSRDAFSN